MDYITTSEAAERLGVSRQRVGQLITAKRLPVTAFGVGGGKLLLIRPADLAPLMSRPTGRPRKNAEKTRAKTGRKKS